MKIIYGRTGSGKSEYIYNKIKDDKKNKIFIITPEQFSFNAEKRLLENLEEGTTTNVEVLSFNRMAYRVIKETIANPKKIISKAGKAMVIYNTLNKNKKNLQFLGKTLENVEVVINQINELKKHNISIEKIENTKIDNTYLKYKIDDILVMYKAINQLLEKEFVDENALLDILKDRIKQSQLFNDSIFYIDEFAGFTEQEYLIIKEINEIAKEVYITVCTDDLYIKDYPENDVFYDNKQNIQTLCNLFDLNKDEQINIIGNRFKNEELKHLEKNLFEINYKSFPKEVKNINLFLSENQYKEIEYVASKIIELVREQDYRYRDIAIISNDIETYNSLIKVIFRQYNIPVFIDEKKDITQNILIRYVLSIIEILGSNWSYESVFNYLKTGLVKVDNIYDLENYCLKWEIKGKKWYEKDWDYEETLNYNEERKKIVDPILKLKEELLKNKNAKTISEKIYDFLYQHIYLENEIIFEEKENIETWNIIVEVLKEISEIFKEEKFVFENYLKILKIGLASKEIGQIPQTQDKVVFGDVNRTKTHRIKALFIIGVNDGHFPKVNKDEGFLNDNDRENLKSIGLQIAKGSKEKIYEENFNIYKAFTTAEEKIYISYNSSNSEGGALRKALILFKLKKIFPKLVEESKIEENISTKDITFLKMLNNIEKTEWKEVYKWYEKNDKERLERALLSLEYNNQSEEINKINLEKMYNKEVFTSISKLETYQKCPFLYFLKYDLKLKKQERFELKTLDTGIFIHDICDLFFKKINYKVDELTEEKIKEIVDEILNEKLNKYSKIILSVRNQVLIKKLKEVLILSLKYIVKSIKQSEFKILGSEIVFGKNNNYKELRIKLDEGKDLLIEGKIDRADIAQTDNEKYVRVIDYKSSKHSINLNELKAGTQLQLITYLDIVKINENASMAGALYFTIQEESKKLDRQVKEIDTDYQMNGMLLASKKVVKLMDKEIAEDGKSGIIKVKIKENEVVSNNSITEEDFEKLQKYKDQLIKKIGENIIKGKRKIEPVYLIGGNNKKACEYCEFKNICQFDTKIRNNKYRYIDNKTVKEILSEI